MPGLVLDVLVAEGDRVERGDVLVLLSAMKMELRIAAPAAGQVTRCIARPARSLSGGSCFWKASAYSWATTMELKCRLDSETKRSRCIIKPREVFFFFFFFFF